MKRELPKHVYRKPKGVYFQRRGYDTHRFEAEPGTPEFAAEYAMVLRGRAPVPEGKTLKALVISYKQSRRWAKLSPRSKSDYQKVLDYITTKLGHLPADKMQRKDVIRAQESNADSKRFANYIVQVLRVMMEHAHDIGWRADNPAKGVLALDYDSTPRQPWPTDKIAAYRKRAALGSRQRLIFEMLLGTGQRIGDVLKMRWDDLSEGGVNVTQQKTGAALWIPLTRDLRAALDATKKTGLTICAQPNGRPTSYRGAADMVMKIRKEIGAEAYDLHSLRYAAAAELAALGCDDDLIMSVTGHKSRTMVAKYAGSVRQKTRAKEAQKRR